MNTNFHTIIIGAGAAGVFAAIASAEKYSSRNVMILEKTGNALMKVKVSGGGRCNVTHACFDKKLLTKNYPRGERELINAFHLFDTTDTINWFKNNGVLLKTEADGRMFPVSDSSQTIIDCLMHGLDKHNIDITYHTNVLKFEKKDNSFYITTTRGDYTCEKLIIATGGYSKAEQYEWLRLSGVGIIDPVPSLFSVHIPNSPFKNISGSSTPLCEVKILNTKFQFTGPVLFTHLGLSGPCILKLSAFAAGYAASVNYQFKLKLNFMAGTTQQTAFEELALYKNNFPNKKVCNLYPTAFTARLWELLCTQAGLDEKITYHKCSNKQLNKLAEIATNMIIDVNGKSPNKEEFVTSGGIDLKEINMNTFEHKKIPNLFATGEALNIDGITGGFNFQNAWTSGFLAGSV
ncbi:MAG: NAD(P)/FAD-dependent oxidoreductase [Bacteroidetes bacterium]|nr:NAD(P)/FAD-dependent oxidoreductase [Bacteroidota bacterium]